MMRHVLLLTLCMVASAFRFSILSSRVAIRRQMASSDDNSSDPAIAAIRAKMEADPNYNPMADPQAQQVL
jgi:hypothetical protein